MLSTAMLAEGEPVQFVVLSDVNATDFVGRTSVPIFRDPSGARVAWAEMEPGAVKHDTFVFDQAGVRRRFWDASSESFAAWATDIRAEVEALTP
ncbi:MAG: hypothetical protein KBG28_00370 [Kofleriaceae bacterium]|jgi:hypothetical protein|nr:hypothetical protein [Kofleriaceae bacterium]MBP6840144.1 hypothetical protein [Kofleriaceae bacterium]MBP9202402.1 hypothetical protein [Kofleriaceae bacterium]